MSLADPLQAALVDFKRDDDTSLDLSKEHSKQAPPSPPAEDIPQTRDVLPSTDNSGDAASATKSTRLEGILAPASPLNMVGRRREGHSY